MSTLHITNGDCAGDILKRVVTGQVAITADVLHEGPAPDVNDDEWHALRGRFLSASDEEADRTRRALADGDRRLDEAASYDDVVLWFEHDLFDQLQIVRTLDRLVRLAASDTDANVESGFSGTFARTNVSMICIDRHPALDRFIGIGQLTDEQMAALFPSRTAVTDDQFALGRDAWRAFRAADPRELFALARSPRCDALPFLRAALLRFFAEYPSTFNGLSRTAHKTLRVLSDGPRDMVSSFFATQQDEAAPFMGDLSFFHIVEDLAGTSTPLVAVDRASASDRRHRQVSLTAAGRDVLAGRADAVELNGIDTWRGGVHLHGERRSPWRWDEARETLVS